MDYLLRLFRLQPPTPPRPPAVAMIPVPRQLRIVPGGRRAWTEAMGELQHEVDAFFRALHDLTWWDGVKSGGPYFLIAGLIVGFVLGFAASGWLTGMMARRAKAEQGAT